MRNRQTDNSKALAAFIARKAEIDAMLARIKALSDEHFHANPDTLHWGHVGDLEFYAQQLRRITDAAFSEGEHAEAAGKQVEVFNYGIGIFGRAITCILVDGDYYVYGVTQNGYPRVVPSIGMAREVAASALPNVTRGG